MDFFDSLKNNKTILLVISFFINIIFLIAFGFLCYKYLNYNCVCENDVFSISQKDVELSEVEEDKFYVEIKGAVKRPGVYEANNKSIINDIVKLSGGFSKGAYTKNINLSRKVTNELVIYVYTETEYKKKNQKQQQPVCECPTYDISDCILNGTSEIVSSDKNTLVEEDLNVEPGNTLVNINTASKEELMTVSGIGESKAKSIIEYRDINGKFKSIEEIKNISGIGDALFEKIKSSITV